MNKEVYEMVNLTTSIIAGVSAPLIVALIIYMVKQLKKRAEREKQNALNDQQEHEKLKHGLRSLLKYQILEVYNNAMNRGAIPSHEKDILNEMYRGYQDLGGNGFITGLMDKIEDLDVV